MTSLLRGVVNWLDGSTETLQDNSEEQVDISGFVSEMSAEVTESDTDMEFSNERSSKAAIKEDLMEVSLKAVHTAKEWGGYLYSLGKMTGGQVSKTAGFIKSALDVQVFSDEGSSSPAGQGSDDARNVEKLTEVPWAGYAEAETMKSQILALSKDKQNFLRSPPPAANFTFDYAVNHPMAQVMLEEDPDLKVMRFELVPKQVREESFWQNYFYRVSLIKQSAHLTSLAKHSVLPRPSATDSILADSVDTDSFVTDEFDVQQSKVCPQLSDHVLNDPPEADELDLDDFELVNTTDLETIG